MSEGQDNPWDGPDDASDENRPVPAESTVDERTPAAEPPPAAPMHVDDEPVDPNRNRVVLIALGAFVVIALVGFFLSQGGDDPVATGGSTTIAGQPTTPQASLEIAGTSDAFNRDDSTESMGAVPNGTPWTVVTGSWGINAGTAYVANPDPARRNIAWVPTGHADNQVAVKITKMAPQTGLVFRFAGDCSFWTIESSPAVATWNVYKVEQCKATQMGNLGYTAVGDGVTLAVRSQGNTITIAVNGKVVKTIEDPTLAGSGKVGLVSFGGAAGEARFDDFVAGSATGLGIVAAPADPDADPAAGTTTVADDDAPEETTTTATQ